MGQEITRSELEALPEDLAPCIECDHNMGETSMDQLRKRESELVWLRDCAKENYRNVSERVQNRNSWRNNIGCGVTMADVVSGFRETVEKCERELLEIRAELEACA